MNLFKRLFPNKNENSKSYKRDKAKSYDGKILRYVTEMTENGDVIIGKSGDITVKEGKLIVCAGGKKLFEGVGEEITCGDLMSLDGVVITGFDDVENRERSIIAYFKYYRK
ncbi:MAG: hypothetical protein E7665_05060 [Ruminococcaceae bacterium]|nr:hypothetical protein [Oscillospiraceae bacterium]